MSQAPVELNKKNVQEQLEKNLKAILIDCPKYKCLVGIPASVKKTDQSSKVYTSIVGDVTVAQYARLNEFGSFSLHIPSRPFMRSTFKGDSLKKIQKAAQKIFSDVARTNKGAKEALDTLSVYAAGQVQQMITKGNWIPNSPITIKRKGSSKPLIDTGTMRRSIIGWVIKK